MPSKAFVTGQSAGELFAPVDRRKAAMVRGTELHAEYERIEWIAAGEAKDEFERSFVKPEGLVELWREHSFEVSVGDEWISGCFDRVVFTRDAEGLRAEVLDFKTSRLNRGESAAEFADRMTLAYSGQMATYRRALSLLANLPPSRITTSLLLTSTRTKLTL